MCGFNAYNKENDKSTDATNFGGGTPLLEYSTTYPLFYFCVRINFIYTWLNVLAIYFCMSLLCLSREYEVNI